MKRPSAIFRSAVTGSDGTIDPGYLGLYVVMLLSLGSIPTAFLLAAVRMFILPDHPLDLVGIAAVIGGAGGAFGGAAAGVGLFRAGDKDRPVPPAPVVAAAAVVVPEQPETR